MSASEFLEKLDHTLKKEIMEVRRIILEAHPQLKEHLKWNAPSYVHNGNDIVTFNLQGQGFFRLIFHRGAKAKEPLKSGTLIEDGSGLLSWAAPDRAILKFTDMHDVKAKEADIREIVSKWLKAT